MKFRSESSRLKEGAAEEGGDPSDLHRDWLAPCLDPPLNRGPCLPIEVIVSRTVTVHKATDPQGDVGLFQRLDLDVSGQDLLHQSGAL